MNSDCQDTVVVTGAAKGLGLAISKELVASGYRVIGIGRNITPEFDTLPSEHSQFIEFDLTQIGEIHGLVNDIMDLIGQAPYGLVNNAGTGLDGLLATQHASDISRVLTLNLEAPITLTKYVVRQMMKVRRGRIVNISSIIAQTGFSGLSVYGATKAGLEGFTRSLSREVGRAGITVNCVAPGYMITEMTQGLTGSKLESVKRRAPLGLPDPSHAAHAVRYLLELGAEKTTGTILTVDGGSTA
ncbi:SDR family NAD(P)-dependent oxidoreductase [Halomonas sp. ISL-60]|uniref:SDR family NAD(P)-dependent oxidoreductase n=1 Tax=Halomonas sp. ISL-56 TaxID=2819149 RepID=UPI001BE9DC2A|nr:SDR family NAD(P)-dependent oxidoreductase [Halomonas sp. ISL-56]MBT2772450.1 SDR family NAD(P)-dependent oxidoreductase [Halomonas sp. ISL-60]MBT2803369.1 SDR family NAD(P)-dependent oxidoreductase [Halomonas sp. ISL-56]